MADPSNTLSDRSLETSTTLSLRREPACFAFLCSRAVSAPLPIDSINLDLASADYFRNRASLWATLDVRSGETDTQSAAVLGFDETFLRPFTRAFIAAAVTRNSYRMTIMRGEAARQPVVEYVPVPARHCARSPSRRMTRSSSSLAAPPAMPAKRRYSSCRAATRSCAPSSR